MTDHYDVAVLGDGLAAKMAAIAAADEGVSVGLLSDADSPLRYAPGTIDILGYPSGTSEPIVNPFEHLDDLPSRHPYHHVGEEGIREGLSRFDSVVGDSYGGGHTERNALVTTLLGTVKPVARYPASFESGLLSRKEQTLIVGMKSLPGFDGEVIASSLSETVPYEVRGANIELSTDGSIAQPTQRIAGALDRNERWPGDTPIRDTLVCLIESYLEDESRVGLPAILGQNDVDAVREHLETALGVRIFEIPTAPPSIPGRRLDSTLDTALESRQIDTRRHVQIAGFAAEGDRVTELTTESGASIQATEFVLATGGLVAGGLVEDQGQIIESMFDLPTNAPEDRTAWSNGSAFAPQPFARFGVAVDDTLRPVRDTRAGFSASEPPAENLDRAFNNIRACGRILGSFDPPTEHSGSGVAIATGVRAGRLAAMAVTDR